MPQNPEYSIEFWKYGITISRIPGSPGVPLTAMTDSAPKLLGKKAVYSAGIVHHLNHTTHPHVVIAGGELADIERWRQEIEESLKDDAPEQRWWLGTDVGCSSACIFAALAADTRWAAAAASLGKGQTPHDADDFGRCHRLLERFPEWKNELHQVGEKFPGTKWGRLAAIWNDLEKLFEAKNGKALQEMLQTA